MTGLDTNVLVRYLTHDDVSQFEAAAKIIESSTVGDERFLIHPIVLCELVWVLESAYDYGRAEVSSVLERILRTAQFEIPDKETAWGAWDDYRAGRGDFADYLIGRANKGFGAGWTVTFDRGLKDCKQFRVLQVDGRRGG